MVARGEIWWVDFGVPVGSAPGFLRPALVISSDRFNLSRIATAIVAAITSTPGASRQPGNVRLDPKGTALPKPSTVNVSQLLTVDRTQIVERIGAIDPADQRAVDNGLRLVLDL